MNDTKKIERAYLFFGEEKYLVRDSVERLKTAVVDKAMEMMNLSIFEGRAEVDKIIAACETLPFMGNYRMVFVKDSGLFDKGRKDDTEKLKDYIGRIPKTTVLCFREDKVDKRNGLYKAVSKNGACTELNFLKDNELIKWVCEKGEKKIRPANAEYLIKSVGTSMEVLEGEINKLLSGADEKGEITRGLIDSLCTKSPENNVFEMVEAIGKKQPEKALEIYNNMLRMKQSPMYVLKMAARQFKLIMQCKYLRSKGKNANQIAEELKQRSFVVRDCLNQAGNFKMASLINAIDDCARCDIDFKSGRITDKLGVEVIILKYSRREENG